MRGGGWRALSIGLAILLAAPDPAWGLVGGRLVRPQDWRAIGRYRAERGLACSAVLVGPRVILTAAHCVEAHQGRGGVSFGGQWYRAEMISSPDYNDAFLDGLDLAVGILERAPRGVAPIPVVDDHTSVQLGDDVSLFGFGCCGQGGRGGGELRTAEGRVSRVGDHDFDIGDGFDTVEDGVSLCDGDSGGPTLMSMPDGLRVIGLHSQGVTGACVSEESRLDVAEARAFLRAVSESRQVGICGLTVVCPPFVDPRGQTR